MTFEEWPVVVAEIPVDGIWEHEILVTSEDGSALGAGWAAKAVLRESWDTGAVIATLHTTPADGTITLTDVDDVWTRVEFLLPLSFTSTLTPSLNAAGAHEQAGVGSLTIWKTADPANTTRRVCDFMVRIKAD